MKTRLITMMVLAMMLALSVPLYAQQTDPAAVFTALADALNAGDVDAALALVADDAVLTFPDMGYVFTGKVEIRGWYEGLVAQNLRAEPSNLQVDGDKLTWSNKVWIDDYRALGIAPLGFTGEGVVQDGKIKSYTETMTDEALAKLQAAMATLPASGGTARTAALLPWLAVGGSLLLALGLGLRQASSRAR